MSLQGYEDSLHLKEIPLNLVPVTTTETQNHKKGHLESILIFLVKENFLQTWELEVRWIHELNEDSWVIWKEHERACLGLLAKLYLVSLLHFQKYCYHSIINTNIAFGTGQVFWTYEWMNEPVSNITLPYLSSKWNTALIAMITIHTITLV